MKTIKFKKGKTRTIAHRGLSGIETENTISAFVAAGNRRYFGIETDVHITADGSFVVIHDSDTKRVCEKSLVIEETPIEEIRTLILKNLHHTGEGEADIEDPRGDMIVPTLAEYVGICRKYKKKCVLEIKKELEPHQLDSLVDEMFNLDYLENVIFISFKLSNLIYLRKLIPEASLQYLIMHYDEQVRNILNEYNIDLDIWDQVLTKEIIDEVHNDGHKINCWTVDNREDAEGLASWGVDYITTNILE